MEQQDIILVTRDFAEATAVVAALKARGIACEVDRVSREEGARLPTKRVTVAKEDAAAASEVVAAITARRSRVRKALPAATEPDNRWNSFIDGINLGE